MSVTHATSKLSETTPIKADTAGLRNTLLLLVFSVVLIGIGLFFLFVLHKYRAFMLVYAVFSGVLFLVLSLWRGRGWRRTERRRQLAAAGERERVRLADLQPDPDAAALPVPTILTMNYSRAAIIAMCVFLFVAGSLLSLLGAAGIPLFFTNSDTVSLSPLAIAIVAVIVVALLIFSILGIRSSSREVVQQIELTSEGLRKRADTKETFISWQEARLFAIVPANPIRRKAGKAPQMYELSSSNNYSALVD